MVESTVSRRVVRASWLPGTSPKMPVTSSTVKRKPRFVNCKPPKGQSTDDGRTGGSEFLQDFSDELSNVIESGARRARSATAGLGGRYGSLGAGKVLQLLEEVDDQLDDRLCAE